MTNEDRIINLAERLCLRLDINYIRGYVKIENNKFLDLTDALNHLELRYKNAFGHPYAHTV